MDIPYSMNRITIYEIERVRVAETRREDAAYMKYDEQCAKHSQRNVYATPSIGHMLVWQYWYQSMRPVKTNDPHTDFLESHNHWMFAITSFLCLPFARPERIVEDLFELYIENSWYSIPELFLLADEKNNLSSIL